MLEALNKKFVLEIIVQYLDDIKAIKQEDALPSTYLGDIKAIHLRRIEYFCRRYQLQSLDFTNYYLRKYKTL